MKRRSMAPKRQDGAIAIIVGVALVALIGMAGLVLDLGQLFVARSEVQNAADGCALAAAHSFRDEKTLKIAHAEAAAILTTSAYKVRFQGKGVTTAKNETVEFATSVDGPWRFASQISSTDPDLSKIQFAKCTVTESGIPTWMVQVLEVIPGVQIGDQSVSASAIATLVPSQTTCAIPVALCSNKLTSTTPVGTWLEGASTPTATYDPSYFFHWVDLNTDQGGGAKSLGDMLTGDGMCDLPSLNTLVGSSGSKSGITNEWNTRFGVYQGSYKPATVAPDYSGYAYWPSGGNFNKYPDFDSKRTANEPYAPVKTINVQGDILTKSDLAKYGEQRRVAVAPVVDCSGYTNKNHQAKITSWACVFMLQPMALGSGAGGAGGNGQGNGKGGSTGGSGASSLTCGETDSSRMCLEYLGPSNKVDSPCSTNGVPGDTSSAGALVPTLLR